MSNQRYSKTVQTTDSTPTVVFSTVVPSGATAFLTVDFQIINSGVTGGAAGNINALFRRPPLGNVARATGNSGAQKASLALQGDFTTSPNIELIADTGSQSARIRITGLTGVNLTWKMAINVRRN